MLFITAFLFLWGVSSIYAVSITASDLPECAVECYCATGEKVKIPVTDYEGQCRSAPFQISLRECAEKACNEEEYAFTEYHAKEYCAEFGVDTDRVLLEYERQKQPPLEEKQIEGLDGSIEGEIAGEDGTVPDSDGIEETDFASATATSTGTCCKSSAVAKETSGSSASSPTAASVASATASVSSTPSGVVSGSSMSTARSWLVGVVCLLVVSWVI